MRSSRGLVREEKDKDHQKKKHKTPQLSVAVGPPSLLAVTEQFS